MSSIDPGQILYLLQEDERMFYPRGDDRLRCAETLAEPRIRFVVNSELLFKHLTEGDEPLPNIARQGCWFEPAFPLAHYRDEPEKRRNRNIRNFLFYARPHNLRNLYWRGLEAIARAIDSGVLPPSQWRFTFVGRDLEPVALPLGVRPAILQNLSWGDYAALVRETDIGLSMIDTPHPSYPPLDLAASGAVVVTNSCGLKTSLGRYSENILCVAPTIDALVTALGQAAAISLDEKLRSANYARNRFERNWTTALEPVLRRWVNP